MHTVPKIWISAKNPSLSWLEHADATVICPSFCTVNRISSKKNQTYCLKSWQYLFGGGESDFLLGQCSYIDEPWSTLSPNNYGIQKGVQVYPPVKLSNYPFTPKCRGTRYEPQTFLFLLCDASPGFPFAKIISVGFLSMIERISSPCCIIQLCCYRVDIHKKLS